MDGTIRRPPAEKLNYSFCRVAEGSAVLSDRQIEGGHHQAERDELQGDARAHQALAGDCTPPPNHVPQAEREDGRDRKKRQMA